MESLPQSLETLNTMLGDYNLQHRRDEINALVRPAILLRTHSTDEEKLSIGQTKIGGLPDLPEEWAYPSFADKSLAFLAQVNLAEIPSTLNKSPLPSRGILYFFSVFGWQMEDGDLPRDLPWERSGETGFSQVLYFDSEHSLLKRRSKPDDKKVFKATSVDFIEILSLPRGSKYARDPILEDLNWTEDEFERFTDLYFDFDFKLDNSIGSTPKHKLLGYPDPIHAEVTQEETRLLCQIDSDYHNADTDMMFGDGGIIYFTIPSTNLERLDFSRIESDLQSG